MRAIFMLFVFSNVFYFVDAVLADQSDPGRLRTAFYGQLDQCTERYGYDPNKAVSLGAYEIGEGELDWRDCAYDQIREVIIPETRVPSIYAKLIAEDKAMTLAIREGTLTRQERRARLEHYASNIELTENLQAQADRLGQETEQQRRMRQYKDDEMERMANIPYRFQNRLPSDVARGFLPR